MILKNVNNGDKDMRNVVVSWWMSNYLLIFFFYLEIKCCHRGIFIHDFFFFLILISYVSHNGVDFLLLFEPHSLFILFPSWKSERHLKPGSSTVWWWCHPSLSLVWVVFYTPNGAEAVAETGFMLVLKIPDGVFGSCFDVGWSIWRLVV